MIGVVAAIDVTVSEKIGRRHRARRDGSDFRTWQRGIGALAAGNMKRFYKLTDANGQNLNANTATWARDCSRRSL
jgi:hypothetical protein